MKSPHEMTGAGGFGVITIQNVKKHCIVEIEG